MCGFLVNTGNNTCQSDLVKEFQKLSHRGPDSSIIKHPCQDASMFFHRLEIQGLSETGNQPFDTDFAMLVCNGEIYNSVALKEQYCADYCFTGNSDCEVLLPLFKKWGIHRLCLEIDAEFAFVIYDKVNQEFFAARDIIGIRPLFYGIDQKGDFFFASEAKALHSFCEDIKPFPPGHYWSSKQGFVCFRDITEEASQKSETDRREALIKIRQFLIEAVEKRLASEVPVGFLLSGGLDSSLICAIANDLLPRPITTFAVGIDENPIDIKYARQVADFLKSDHHEYLFSFEDVLKELPNVIYHLESYDVTTIRASIGMYLLCKYIRQNTDTVVLLTGEVSDELFGYKYTDFAPSPQAFQKESQKRIKELYMYDVLRCDRCISAHSLEARVPFGDIKFASYIYNIDPELKMNRKGVGKSLLREAFSLGVGQNQIPILPHNILFREKAAFSDAVGHALVDQMKAYAEKKYSKADILRAQLKFPHCPPLTKEALFYREIFEDFFPNQGKLIKAFWMPNKQWLNCQVDDPSARCLPNYGASGF